MDILAHGLWTNLVYHKADTPEQLLAIGLGMAPDTLAFGPLLIKQLVTRQIRTWRKVDATTYDHINRVTPRWVFRAYDITHSIPIWLVGFSLWWLLAGFVPWPAFAWLIHILVDIPTHSRKFFPTPFLWPLSLYTFDGISWGVPWFMRLNYGALLVGYMIMWLL